MVFIKPKFLRILNYSESFQGQFVTFSSVIILSEKEKNTEYSSTWIYSNIFLSVVHFIWCTARYMVRQTLVPCNVTRSTKLRGALHSPELVLRSMEFQSPENLIFPALYKILKTQDVERMFFIFIVLSKFLKQHRKMKA